MAFSFFVTTIVVANAANHYQQFYPTVVNLMNSKLSRIVLINDALLLVVLFGLLCKKLFFGTLRTYEEEKTWENSYVTLIETCLALTIFRGEMSSMVFAMFVSMLFIQIFHWIAQMRVQYIESLPSTSALTFFRLYSLIFLMVLADSILSYVYFMHWLDNGPTVRVLFLTEYLIMTVKSLTIAARLNFHAYNLYRQHQQERTHHRDNVNNEADFTPGWENHSVAIFYLDIISDLLQSIIYISFFLIIMSKYGFPIHLLRDIYVAIRSVKKRITDLINYRRLVSNLDQRFPDATPEELAENHLCVICREELRTNVKRLPCGHLFHANCLRGWLEQTQECPTCRAPVEQDAYNIYARERGHSNARRTSNAAHQQQSTLQQQPQQQPIVSQPQNSNIQELYMQQMNNMQQMLAQLGRQNQPLQTQVTNVVPQYLTSNNIATLQSIDANRILTNMYIQYLENSKRIIESTLEQLRNLQQQQEDSNHNSQ